MWQTLKRHGRRDAGDSLPTAIVQGRCCRQQHTVEVDEHGPFVFHGHSLDERRRFRDLEEIGGPVFGCLKVLQRWCDYIAGRAHLAQLPEELRFAAKERACQAQGPQSTPAPAPAAPIPLAIQRPALGVTETATISRPWRLPLGSEPTYKRSYSA